MNKVSIDDFLSQYTQINTKYSYRSSLKAYFLHVYPYLLDVDNAKEMWQRLNEASVEYVSIQRDYRKDMISYRDANLGKAPKTISIQFTAIVRFLQDNEIVFSPLFLRNLVGRGSQHAISAEYVPTQSDISRLLEYMPINAKALTLFLSSSGARIGEALQVKVGDIDFDKSPARVRLVSVITKTKVERTVFVSSECVAMLKEWLAYRPEYIKVSGRKGQIVKEDSGLLFPFIYAAYNQMWANAVQKAGLYQRDERTRRLTLHIHTLRKFFRSREWKNPDYPEILIGHSNGLMGIYARYTIEKLAEAYLEVEPSLSVFEGSKNVLELKSQVKQQSSDIDAIIKSTTIQNARLQNEMLEQEKSHGEDLAKVWNVVGELTKIVSDPDLARKVSDGVAEHGKKEK